MKAMVLRHPGEALSMQELPVPVPQRDQVLIAVEACGVCRTDLHVIDGELAEPSLPIIPGHEIVGQITALGENVRDLQIGQRVGVPWLGHTCGRCGFCHTGHENLCDGARFTGYQIQGGYADYTVAEARYCFALPQDAEPDRLAPLLCAGLIGYRSLRMAGDPHILGLYGFGAAAHIIAQVAIAQGRKVYAITRPGDLESQAFARSLGAVWAGGSDEDPPVSFDAAIIFAPVGALVPLALRQVIKGGTVVCAGIHMSDIPAIPYAWLWGERSIRSVANLTRRDGLEFFDRVRTIPIKTHVTRYPLAQANQALADLRAGRLQGAAVLIPG
jgi:propanol-preferring alcohol dehydrogenase